MAAKMDNIPEVSLLLWLFGPNSVRIYFISIDRTMTIPFFRTNYVENMLIVLVVKTSRNF